ncbi:DddA-like double-stranded DNA deaminase toxin [Kribbella sp. NPDC004536]|uniref:DddA-like double-stranded DNA deaminase toxin n=1 Tax=Kribbella sp. NPDC004536 TaxID=3364106 RepID=UPI00367D82A0
MPSELQRVAEQLFACLNEAPRAAGYLHDRARKCREAAAWIGSTSNNPSARMAAMQLDDAARRCEEAAHYLSLAETRAKQWVEQMVSGIRTVEPSGSATAGRPLDPDGSASPRERRQGNSENRREADKPDKTAGAGDGTSPEAAVPDIDDGEAWRLFAKLPVRRDQPGHREKTRGLWRNEDGTEDEWVSGFDEWRDKADRFAVAEKIGEAPHLLQITSHVEIKFAMFMRERGLRRATLVINNRPCPGEAGCDEMLKDFLPKGAALTIFGPNNFKETYPKPTKPEGTESA